jgi:squalene monooxygenase
MSPNIAYGLSYDVFIVGAGIAGSAFAHALFAIVSTSRAAPLLITLLERSLAEPDHIVGELL